MARQKFRDTAFRADSLARIERLQEVVDEYKQQGLRLTARQLYYQFVSRDYCPNTPVEYKKLTALLTDARYAGLIDWDVIEDRGREPSTPSEWNDIGALTESALRAYRLPRWKGQDNYVELWVEKQALAGVLAPIAREYHATLMVNKGYSSASAMKESADRINGQCILDKEKLDAFLAELKYAREEWQESGDDEEAWDEIKTAVQKRVVTSNVLRTPIILYLGDHDPSGEDMVRDISTRLKEFGVYWLKVEKIGLTMAQVKRFNPPPNPAKITDPRAASYIAKFGDKSWEVDALPPVELTRIIRAAFAKHIDKAKLAAILMQEETDKAKLRDAVSKIVKGKRP